MSTSTAMDYALRLLAQRAYSIGQIREKLVRKKYEQNTIEACIERLEELGYLNDHVFAESVVRNYQNKYGAGRIAQILQSKHINHDIITEALHTLSPEKESEVARQIVERELRKPKNTFTDKKEEQRVLRNLTHKLIRGGYHSGLAYTIVKEQLVSLEITDNTLWGEEIL